MHKEKNIRHYHLDGVAGAMILYMIYGHICCWVPEIKQIPIFSRTLFLFMPWFFFKSGMFYRKKEFSAVLKGGWHKLLIPYIVFSIIGDIIFDCRYLLEGITDWRRFVIAPIRIIIHQGAVAGNAPLWFLLTLFFVKTIYNAIPNKRYCYLIVTFTSGGVTWWLYSIGFADYYWIANTLLGIFFYGLGHEFAERQYNPIIALSATIIYVGPVIFEPTYVDFRSNTMTNNGSYPIWMVASLCGVIMFNYFFKILPQSFYKLLAFVGHHSMSYFIMHWCVMGILQIVLCKILGYHHPEGLFVIYAVSIITLCPVIERIFIKLNGAWLLGK